MESSWSRLSSSASTPNANGENQVATLKKFTRKRKHQVTQLTPTRSFLVPCTSRNRQTVYVDMDEKDGEADLVSDTELLVKGGGNVIDRCVKVAGN